MDAGTITFNDQMRENAEKSTGMGGKRFLGWTPNGAEAWISYNFDRASKELSIDSTVKLSLLLEEGAELADCRVSIKRGSTNRTDVNQLLRMSRRDSTGAVTPTTVKYLMRLKGAVNGGSGIGFEKGLPTKTLFRMVTNSIYAGGVDEKDFRWYDAMEAYGLPSGEYFTWEKLPNIVEE